MEEYDNSLKGAFINYVRKVAEHARADYLRHIRYLEQHEVLMDDARVSAEEAGYWLDHYESHDEALTETCKRLLTPMERQVLYHSIIIGHTTKDAACLMRVSERWIRVARTNALRKLKEAIERGSLKYDYLCRLAESSAGGQSRGYGATFD